jgi:hypothetical protein
MTAGETKADRRDRRANNSAGQPVQDLGRKHERETRAQRQNKRRGCDHEHAKRNQPSLPAHGIGEGAAGNLGHHASQSAGGKD